MTQNQQQPAPNPGLSLTELDNLPDKPVEPAVAEIKPLEDGTPANLQNQAPAPEPEKKKEEPPAEAESDSNKGLKDIVSEDEPSIEEDPVQFWQQVDQITGKQVEVDYGTDDPLSPAGVAKREIAVRQQAAQDFEKYLETLDPRGYAYLMHREAGGSDEDFFAQKSYVLPAREDFENSIEMQTQMVKRTLLSKGIPDDVVQSTVDKYIKDNNLKEKALHFYEDQDRQEKAHIKLLQEENDKQQNIYRESVTNVLGAVTEAMSAADLKFVIPEASKAAFHQFIKENIRYDNGNFYIVNEIGKDLKNLVKLVESQYFQYLGGDVSKLVQKKAGTVATQRLRTAISKDKNSNTRNSAEQNNNRQYVPLGEI